MVNIQSGRCCQHPIRQAPPSFAIKRKLLLSDQCPVYLTNYAIGWATSLAQGLVSGYDTLLASSVFRTEGNSEYYNVSCIEFIEMNKSRLIASSLIAVDQSKENPVSELNLSSSL